MLGRRAVDAITNDPTVSRGAAPRPPSPCGARTSPSASWRAVIGVNEPTGKAMITSACVTPLLPSDYSILLGSGYRNAAGITDAGAESAAADAWKACRRRHDQRSDGIRGSGPSGCGGSLIPRRRASSNLHFRPAASSRKAVLRKLLPAPEIGRAHV